MKQCKILFLSSIILISGMASLPAQAESFWGRLTSIFVESEAAGFTREEEKIIREVLKDVVGVDVDDDDSDDDDKADKKKNKGKHKGLPPGLAKRGGDLPPGLEKQIEKNGTLPPGLAKRDLPDELEARLPERNDDKEIVLVGADAVLVDKATDVVIDILKDVLN